MFGLILDIKREKSRKLSHIMNECTLGFAMWRKLVLIKALKREVGPNRWWYISIEIGIGIRIEDKGQHNILVCTTIWELHWAEKVFSFMTSLHTQIRSFLGGVRSIPFWWEEVSHFRYAIEAFLDFGGFNFCNFRFNAVYNSILFSSLIVQLSNLDLPGFCFHVFYVPPH